MSNARVVTSTSSMILSPEKNEQPGIEPEQETIMPWFIIGADEEEVEKTDDSEDEEAATADSPAAADDDLPFDDDDDDEAAPVRFKPKKAGARPKFDDEDESREVRKPKKGRDTRPKHGRDWIDSDG